MLRGLIGATLIASLSTVAMAAFDGNDSGFNRSVGFSKPSGSLNMPAPTVVQGAAFNYGTACSGSCLAAEDNFSSATLNTTFWQPFLYCCTFGRWNAAVFAAPYSGQGNQTAHSFNLEYYDPFPYGLATDDGDGQHLFINSNGLNFLASKGVTNTQALSATFTWTSAFISANPSGGMQMPATGGFWQAKIQQPDSSNGGWAVPFWFQTPASTGAGNATNNWDLEGGYTCNGASTGNVCNGVGVNNQTNGWMTLSGGSQFNLGYHIYGVEYLPGVSLKYFLDNKLQLTLTPGACAAANGGICNSGVPPAVTPCTPTLIQAGSNCFPTGVFVATFGMQMVGNGLNSTNTSPCGGTPCTTQTQGFHTWASSSTTGPYTMSISDIQRWKVPGGS